MTSLCQLTAVICTLFHKISIYNKNTVFTLISSGGTCIKGVKTQDVSNNKNNNSNINNHNNNRDNTHNKQKSDDDYQSNDSMTEHDTIDDSSFKPPPKRGRRQAVAAESYDPTTDETTEEQVVFYPKTEEQLKCLREAASNIIFFKKCELEQRKNLLNAMFEKKVQADEVIIRQGDDGDNFYVIEKGEYDIFVKDNAGEEKKVATLSEGFFGELALLYNCPRNATIVSATNDGVLWGLDQKTFREVVVKATARKRAKFEELLKGVSMLDSLTGYELVNLTDALEEVAYESEEAIIHEGDNASEMYFIMEGKVAVRALDTKSNTQKEIVVLNRGQYFGELALVLKKPRVASVYALTKGTKCAVLDINAFERLLGPCVDIMKRNIGKYEAERQRLGINSGKLTADEAKLTKGVSEMKIKK